MFLRGHRALMGLCLSYQLWAVRGGSRVDWPVPMAYRTDDSPVPARELEAEQAADLLAQVAMGGEAVELVRAHTPTETLGQKVDSKPGKRELLDTFG